MNLAAIELLVLDVDGVLTDGRIVLGPGGELSLAFHVQDGRAIKQWQARGGRIALLSGREGGALDHRARELGIQVVRCGVTDKAAAYKSLLADLGVPDSVTAYIGDDEPDLGPMARAALPVAVANAVPRVKRAARYVTRRRGGHGAVAEVLDLIGRVKCASVACTPIRKRRSRP
jgi:3-deoxy-D-manno-octulosonate 8-phosphate phosphatase (KDO 8-P phosphatase)